jgi:glycosyltransferase involved in cell wall biosynthesis
VNTDNLRPAHTANRCPLIVHAPNHRWLKGTDHVLAAVEAVQARGFACELSLVENVHPSEARRRFAEADIVADQFCSGSFGLFGLEGLALGKPVLAYLDQEQVGDPAFDLPVVNANPDNLAAVLAVVLALPELRARLGRAGRAAVERVQSVPALGEVWARIYRHVWWREALQLESTAHFSADRRPRAFTEDPRDEAFWPVPVSDLAERLREVVALGR